MRLKLAALIGIMFFPSVARAINIQLVPFASGFSNPLYVTHAGDGSGRVFVVEQTGTIQVLDSTGGSLGQFLDISSLLFSGSGEQGLLGLAFHPDYATNGKFYVNYSGLGLAPAGQTVIAEYTVSGDPNVANTTERRLLLVPDPETNHNGGWTAFGPDGFLYIAIGDGGGGGDNHGTIGNAQDTTMLLGKILRIDVNTDDFPADPDRNYGIPSDNPFAASVGSEAKEIYAYGLRNPWRCSFDRANGRLYCADVGQASWEEVDIIVNGGNYGWRCMEGYHTYNDSTANCTTATFIDPIHEYGHNTTGDLNRSITGGYVYRGAANPGIVGLYFFADYNSGRIWTLDGTCTAGCASTERINTPYLISSFGEDESGEIYVCGHGNGVVYKLVDTDINSAFSWEFFE